MGSATGPDVAEGGEVAGSSGAQQATVMTDAGTVRGGEAAGGSAAAVTVFAAASVGAAAGREGIVGSCAAAAAALSAITILTRRAVAAAAVVWYEGAGAIPRVWGGIRGRGGHEGARTPPSSSAEPTLAAPTGKANMSCP